MAYAAYDMRHDMICQFKGKYLIPDSRITVKDITRHSYDIGFEAVTLVILVFTPVR